MGAHGSVSRPVKGPAGRREIGRVRGGRAITLLYFAEFAIFVRPAIHFGFRPEGWSSPPSTQEG